MLIRVGISCYISYSILSFLLYALVDQITAVGEERATFSAIVYLQFCVFCFSWYLVWAALICCGNWLALLLIIWKVNYDTTAVHRDNLIKTSSPKTVKPKT